MRCSGIFGLPASCVFVFNPSLPLQQYFEHRSKTIKALRAIPRGQHTPSKPDPYPHKFHVSISVPNFVEKYSKQIKNPGEHLDKEEVSVAGRIHNTRASGAKLRFYDLWSEGVRLQVMGQQQ